MCLTMSNTVMLAGGVWNSEILVSMAAPCFKKREHLYERHRGKLRKPKLVIASILTQLIAEKIEIGFSNPNFTILNFKNYKENFNIF